MAVPWKLMQIWYLRYESLQLILGQDKKENYSQATTGSLNSLRGFVSVFSYRFWLSPVHGEDWEW
jgi:hypothetical protein